MPIPTTKRAIIINTREFASADSALPRVKYGNTPKQCIPASDHIANLAKNRRAGGGGHGLSQGGPGSIVIGEYLVLS